MKRIILIGYMGAGKTTVGKALSKELGIIFYDLDWYIESRMRKTVAQIFAERGEEGFRKIEYNLKAAPEVLYKHLQMARVERPLIKGKSQEELLTFIREQLERREPYYSKARYTLDVSLMDSYDKIKYSVEKLKDILGI